MQNNMCLKKGCDIHIYYTTGFELENLVASLVTTWQLSCFCSKYESCHLVNNHVTKMQSSPIWYKMLTCEVFISVYFMCNIFHCN